MSIARKYRKLLRSPTRFFYDFFSKRLEAEARSAARSGSRVRQKLSDGVDYSVIAAVYGVEPYIGAFLESIVDQTIGFEERIELILVDDGSPDGSVAIIEAWQRRYPNNIRLVRKENGGVASARNAGLEVASGEWVTFIDPDDTISPNYFEQVDDFLARTESEVSAVSCKVVFFDESTGLVRDTHPLRARFARAERVVDLLHDGTVFNLMTTNTFMRRSVLQRAGLRFDSRIRPTFEDGTLFNLYLLACGDYRVGLLKNAIYYYRKRSLKDSAIDTAWRQPEQYGDKLEFGYLTLLRAYRKTHGRVPVFVQNLVLYDLSWYFQQLLDRDERLRMLNEEECVRFERLLEEIYREIDLSLLFAAERHRYNQLLKFGIMTRFYRAEPIQRVAYVQPQTTHDGLGEVRFYVSASDERGWQLWDRERRITPAYQKEIAYRFNRRMLAREVRLWLDLSDPEAQFRLTLGKQKIAFQVARRYYDVFSPADFHAFQQRSVKVTVTRKASQNLNQALLPWIKAKYEGAWIFMDRDVQADDNAEHLYRWIKSNTDFAARCFFVLRRSSHDWKRLEREGFQLIDFDSHEHTLALLNAEWLISSHADEYVVNPLPRAEYGDRLRYRFAFLQHGVTKDDLSAWLNRKPLDLFVTSTPAEHESVLGGSYKFTRREAALTGFPRHDALLARAAATPQRDLVVIMPTWREYLVAGAKGKGNTRLALDDFTKSDYFQNWQQVISNHRLVSTVQASGLTPFFFPHANMQLYLHHFSPAPGMQVGRHAGMLIQELFARCALLITDYSSVAFEVALLRRPVVYFQFDRERVMSEHIYRPGYFDYERDGFGPVCVDAEEVSRESSALLQAGCVMPEPYRARADATFVMQDGRCCERVFAALLERTSSRREQVQDRGAVRAEPAVREDGTHPVTEDAAGEAEPEQLEVAAQDHGGPAFHDSEPEPIRRGSAAGRRDHQATSVVQAGHSEGHARDRMILD